MFNDVFPADFPYINETQNKKTLVRLLDSVYDQYGREETVTVANAIKDLGFVYATQSGKTMNVFDMTVPDTKQAMLDEGDIRVKTIHDQWFRGFLSDDEKHNLIIGTWGGIKSRIDTEVKSIYAEDNDLSYLVVS